MKRRDCPHCYSRIFPTREGLCPSCRGDLSAPKLQPLTSVQIRLGDEIPLLCVCCGQATKETIDVGRSKTEGGQAWPIKVLVFLFSPMLMLLAQRELQGKRSELSFQLPFCASCRSQRPAPQPAFVNYAQHEMELIVHDDFGAAFRGEGE